MAGHPTARVLTAAIFLAGLLPTSARAQDRQPSPFDEFAQAHRPVAHTLVPTDALFPPAGAAIPAADPLPHPSEPTSTPTSSHIAGGALLASIGSFGFMYAGAYAGWMYGGDQPGGYNYGGLLYGAAAGSVLGSTLGASFALGNPKRALLGSLGGGLAGLAIATGIAGLGDGFAGLATFSIIQGTTAALVAGR